MYAYQLIEMLSNVDPNTEVCVGQGLIAYPINSWDYAYVSTDPHNSFRDRILQNVDVEDLDSDTRQVVVLY